MGTLQVWDLSWDLVGQLPYSTHLVCPSQPGLAGWEWQTPGPGAESGERGRCSGPTVPARASVPKWGLAEGDCLPGSDLSYPRAGQRMTNMFISQPVLKEGELTDGPREAGTANRGGTAWGFLCRVRLTGLSRVTGCLC